MNGSRTLTAAIIVALAGAVPAFGRTPSIASTASDLPQVQDVLAAEAEGLVAVRFIPNDSRSAQVIVTNTSKRPLTLRLPEAFVGVPVLAQLPGGGAPPGVPQPVGGGQPAMGMPGGGPFSLPPEKVRRFRVPTVCLEHGRREPAPRIPYVMKPLEAQGGDPRIGDVLMSLSSGHVSQKAAQAAAWHVANGLSWERLAGEASKRLGGEPDLPFFAPADLMAARQLVAAATRRQRLPSPASSASSGR